MYECDTCVRCFASQRAVSQHMNDLDHWGPRYECETCDREFNSQRACDQHMDALDHWGPQHECEVCTHRFYSQDAADEHMDKYGHWEHYCKDCRRHFQNENCLNMVRTFNSCFRPGLVVQSTYNSQHLKSRVHRGQDIRCPFCNAEYTTGSGVAHHLETGACPKARGLNRETLHQEIRRRDPHGLMTKNLLEWNKETTWSSTQAWNGSGYECYLCHRAFAAQRMLDQHLASPKHKEKIYHCPSRTCPKDFNSLAGLLNHLESESCRFMRFESVQKQVGAMIAGGKLLRAG